MGINIYDTYAMMAAVRVMPPKSSFLRDRYFGDTDTFPTTDVLVDYEDEQGNRLAPCVLPSKGGIPVAREGFETETFRPALVAPQRPLTADDLSHRQAGESMLSGQKGAERAGKILKRDLQDLNTLIDNREEYMAAQVLLNNGYALRQYADKYGSGEYVEKVIHFYDGDSNPAVYTPAANWSTNSTTILSDISAMAQINIKRGVPMTDLIVAGDVADVMLANKQVLELLDNRRYILTDELRPEEQADGSVKIATVNIKGHIVNIFSYTAEYVDEDGKVKAYIPSGKIVMTAPKMGRIHYGAVTQINFGQSEFETIEGKRVPKVTVDSNQNVRTLTVSSRPLVMPKVKNAAISATVLASA